MNLSKTTVEQWEVLAAVVDEGGFAQAAAALHRSQSVVRDSGTLHPRDEGWLGADRRFTVSSMEASLATILAGLSFAWLPEHLLIESLRSGALRRLPLVSGATRKVSLHMVLLRPELLGPAARAAADAFRRHAGDGAVA
jgi:DNA-binding transcriptional LysR family regulator